MADPFYSPKRKLATARKKIRSVERSVDTFFKGKPHEHVVEPDTNSTNQLHKLKFTKRIPTVIEENTAYAIGNLRASLDHIGYAVAVAAGTRNPKSCGFPFADTASELTPHTDKRACRDIPPEIRALFMSFKPYKGGNTALWALNKACNKDKHITLVPINMASGGVILNKLRVIKPPCTLPAPVWNAIKNEIVVAITGPEAEIEYDFKVKFNIGFGNIEGVAGKPVVDILNIFAGEVERVLVATEAEAKRIGII